jgi:hypothetical protein
MSEVSEVVGTVSKAVSGRSERVLASIARARAARTAGETGGPGRVMVQCRRCFIANNMQPVTATDLRRWAFAGQPRQQWHHWSLTRALRSLGARQIGRATSGNHPAIWSLAL